MAKEIDNYFKTVKKHKYFLIAKIRNDIHKTVDITCGRMVAPSVMGLVRNYGEYRDNVVRNHVLLQVSENRWSGA